MSGKVNIHPNQILRIILLFSGALLPLLIQAQDGAIAGSENQKQDSSSRRKHVKQVDVIDLIDKIRHKETEEKRRADSSKHVYGKTHISVLPALGYTLQTGFAGLLSANFAFYAGNSHTQKLSSILTSLTYSQYKQYIIPVQASIWTKENKYNVVLDLRYMKYPSTTYGLGGLTDLSDEYWLDFSYLRLHKTLFRSVANDMYVGLGYYFDYLWSIREVGLAPNTITVFQQYGLNSREIASGVAFRLLYDSRINQINPDNGFYSNIAYRPNFVFMGSQSNWQSLLFEFKKYFKFPARSNNVVALWNYNWLTAGGKTPYLLLPSTGWDDHFNTGRGYIQGRFRGRDMVYLEAEYRLNITRNGLIGAVVFGNAQAFSKETFKDLKDVSPGGGFGLRVKLNKISGANLCVDYGFGTGGSRGFFVNLNEVF